MSKTFQAPATLTRLSFTSDGGLNLGFVTQELTAEEKLIAARYHRSFGYVLFKENQYTEEDIPQSDATDENKSPSQRLRAALFVWWQQSGRQNEDFESFYRHHMERAINRVKKLLD